LVEQLQFNYPEERIKAIFSKMVECLHKTVRQKGFKPQHYIVGLNSELMDSAKNLHVHQIDDDIADILLNWFVKIDQSGMLKHHKDSLTLQSFEIDILAIELWNVGRHQIKMGKKKQKRHPGTGGPIRFRHNINLDAIMEINNNDNYCLFRSFEILRHRSIMDKRQFYKYKNNEKRQSKDIRNLMIECGIPRNLNTYSIEEWGEKIWEYYQAKHPNKFRLFAFPEIGELKVILLHIIILLFFSPSGPAKMNNIRKKNFVYSTQRKKMEAIMSQYFTPADFSANRKSMILGY
jgi:hypothetical protein